MAKFLWSLGDFPNVGAACRASGIGYSLAYKWRGQSVRFANAWDESWTMGVERLEERAVNMALDPINPSPRTLEFLLKAYKPEVFAPQTVPQPNQALPTTTSTVVEIRGMDYRQAIKALAPPEEDTIDAEVRLISEPQGTED